MELDLLFELIKCENRKNWPSIAETAIQNDLLKILYTVGCTLEVSCPEGYKIFAEIIAEEVKDSMKGLLDGTQRKKVA